MYNLIIFIKNGKNGHIDNIDLNAATEVIEFGLERGFSFLVKSPKGLTPIETTTQFEAFLEREGL